MVRCTLKEHWDVICDFMEKHPGLATGEINSGCRTEYKQLWEELVNQLNTIGDLNRSVEKWQKTWVDFKYCLKKKIKAKYRRTADRNFSSGRISFNIPERRLLPLIETSMHEQGLLKYEYNVDESIENETIRFIKQSPSPVEEAEGNFEGAEEIFLIQNEENNDEDTHFVPVRKRKRRLSKNYEEKDETLNELKKIRSSLESVNTNLGLIATTIQRLGDIMQKRFH